MSTLTAQRVELAQVLTEATGHTCHDSVPEAPEPPCLVLQPADPYLTKTELYDRSEYEVALECWLIVRLDSNAQAADDLDSLLDAVASGLPDGWHLDRVDQPGPLHTADWLAHGQRLILTALTHL